MDSTENLILRGRFAPTPSGRMHLGNLFCALLSWLSIRSKNGIWVLRQEDLDPERTNRKFAEQLEKDLLWLGLSFSEGGTKGGKYAPYFQSECEKIYRRVFLKLQQSAKIYPCFCTRSQLHGANAPHLSDGRVVYDGRCKTLSPEEIDQKMKKHSPAYRIEVPDEEISFEDGCLGECRENLAREFGDFVVRRSDGGFAYQLAVVVDDIRMKVTEIVRGQDLLSSTAPQIYLYRLLKAPVPRFYHIPVLLSPDGERLSKRDHDVSLETLRKKYTAPEILGRLAYLAGQLKEPKAISAEELAAHFDWSRVPRENLRIPAGLF